MPPHHDQFMPATLCDFSSWRTEGQIESNVEMVGLHAIHYNI
jgi:hypothetical protein